MKEVDIWIEVLSKLGWSFRDEETGPGNTNKLIYWKEGQYLNLYFNYKTSEVSSLNIKRTSYDQSDKINVNKDRLFEFFLALQPPCNLSNNNRIFYNLHIDLFREVKLSHIINT